MGMLQEKRERTPLFRDFFFLKDSEYFGTAEMMRLCNCRYLFDGPEVRISPKMAFPQTQWEHYT
jgi:hypothetical protein